MVWVCRKNTKTNPVFRRIGFVVGEITFLDFFSEVGFSIAEADGNERSEMRADRSSFVSILTALSDSFPPGQEG